MNDGQTNNNDKPNRQAIGTCTHAKAIHNAITTYSYIITNKSITNYKPLSSFTEIGNSSLPICHLVPEWSSSLVYQHGKKSVTKIGTIAKHLKRFPTDCNNMIQCLVHTAKVVVVWSIVQAIAIFYGWVTLLSVGIKWFRKGNTFWDVKERTLPPRCLNDISYGRHSFIQLQVLE